LNKFFTGLAVWLAVFSIGIPAIAAADPISSFKSGFNSFIDRDDNAVLPPDQAFQLAVTAIDAQTLNASFTITPGHYLYRDRIKFELGNTGNAVSGNAIKEIELPKGDIKQDPNFGATEVFHTGFEGKIHLASPASGKLEVSASYQGCSEKGLCYAPIHKTYTIDLAEADSSAVAPAPTLPSGSDSIADVLKSGKWWFIVSVFFAAGILVSLTPCMWPMMPVLSTIIVGTSGAPTSRLHSFNLSLAYTLGMALCYTLAGIAAGLSGHLLSSSLQSPWILAASAIVFVLLALAMFGWYELKLPSAFEEAMVNASNRFKGGRFAGVFVMGALSALILSPCVAPALAGALVYISQTRDVVLGGAALFAMSMGMGLPLLLIGASAGAILPKSGPWMSSVRNFFGVLMLGLAVWVISPVIPVSLQLGAWAALLIVPAIYLHALDALPVHASSATKFAKGIAVILLVSGIAMLVGAFSGARSPLQPLSAIALGNAAGKQESRLPFQRIASVDELEKTLQASRGKLVMLDFYADWCVACKELEHFTFSDPRVASALKDAVLLQADVTRDNDQDKALLKRFGLFGPPGIVFFDGNGQELAKRVIGYKNADDFLQALEPLHIQAQAKP